MRDIKIGLALGSGGARGFSHLGVLRVFHEENIKVDYIAGSSMGALVGSLYAAGQSIEDMYQLAYTFKRKYYLDLTVPKMGFIQGNRILEYIRLFTYGKSFDQLPVPLSVIAADLYTGNKVVFNKGSVAEAVRASVSIPGVFVPVPYGDQLLIDGGVIDRVPVSVVKEMGADIVIGVDCAHFKDNHDVHSIYDVIMQSIDIMQDELVKDVKVNADVLLLPSVEQYSSRSFTNIREIVEEGEREARRKLPEIKRMIEKWKDDQR
ncbi:patatin-like phospholipase family protein [Bacillaceae bacterium S4-13-56]